ncbi:MAG: DUF11 domain-containing protein [Dehalococcoidales bacterium]|nr:MAG: DUF11 domain-containing protein [Dehalococcoidales bacterium]
MVKPKVFVSILLLILLTATVSCTCQSSGTGEITPAPTELTMLSIAEGQILVMKAGTDSWTEAGVGTTVELGDILKAGVESRAVITFFEGSTIELEAGAEVEVVELGIVEEAGSTIIRLKQSIGNTVSRVSKLADTNSSYEVETPTAVAAVRGSIMFVQVRQDGATAVGNGDGSVSVSAEGEEVSLPEGTYSTVEQGQPPSAPKPGIGPPALAIAKTAEPSMVHNGDTITYTYLVTNSGGTPLSGISITDDKTGSTEVNDSTVLNVGETWEFSATYTVSVMDPDLLVNTAVASGSDAESQVVTAQDTASVTILRPAINLTKTAEPDKALDGDTITYTYTIVNTGNTPLSDVTVVDNQLGNAAYQSGDSDGDSELDVDESWEFTATYTISSEDESPLDNTATASASDALGQIVTTKATASVSILRPTIALIKSAAPVEAHDGDTITYTYIVTNPGNTPLFDVTVIDDMSEEIEYQSGDSDGDGELDVDESWEFTATYTIKPQDPSPLVNVAVASGSDARGQVVTAEATASVNVERPDLAIQITSPEDGDIITSHTITVTGTVNDLSITQATIDINGSSHTISVINGSFSTNENVSSGINTITVTAINARHQIASDTVAIDVQITIYGIRIELTWDKNDTDMDIHLIRPGGEMWNIPDDCYWNNGNPDWGAAGVSEDNPSLDQDDVDGFGPENLTLEQPEVGIYQVKVDYFDDYDNGPSVATVIIWINDEKVAEYSQEMSDGDTWDCAQIDWPSGVVTPG